MTRPLLSALALCAALALPVSAAWATGSEVKVTDETTQTIRTKLTDMGYEVGNIKTEDGLYEAYAKKDGHRYEVFLNAEFEIVRTKEDD